MVVTDAGRRAADSLSEDAKFDTQFLSHYEGVYRLLYRIVGSAEEAEDLTQETFLQLYRRRFVGDHDGSLRAWLFRAATHLAYNALRGQKRRERRHEVVAARDLPAESQSPDPAWLAERSEEREMVRRVLARLPAHQAQLLLLRHAGLSYRELAEAVEVAPGSVGTLLARATAAFEDAYRRHAQEADQESERRERDEVQGM